MIAFINNDWVISGICCSRCSDGMSLVKSCCPVSFFCRPCHVMSSILNRCLWIAMSWAEAREKLELLRFHCICSIVQQQVGKPLKVCQSNQRSTCLCDATSKKMFTFFVLITLKQPQQLHLLDMEDQQSYPTINHGALQGCMVT